MSPIFVALGASRCEPASGRDRANAGVTTPIALRPNGAVGVQRPGHLPRFCPNQGSENGHLIVFCAFLRRFAVSGALSRCCNSEAAPHPRQSCSFDPRWNRRARARGRFGPSVAFEASPPSTDCSMMRQSPHGARRVRAGAAAASVKPMARAAGSDRRDRHTALPKPKKSVIKPCNSQPAENAERRGPTSSRRF